MWAVLVAFIAHGLGLRGDFVYDDRRFVTENTALSTASWIDIAVDPALQTSDGDRDIYRPVRAVSHAFDLARWGLEPFGFHLHSLLLHVLTVMAAYGALRLLLRPLDRPMDDVVPLAGALALACHPLGAEAVAWITSRGDVYALLFTLVALSAHARLTRGDLGPGRRGILLTAAVLIAALAVLGKESAAVLPLIAAVHVLWIPRRGWSGVFALAAGVALALALRQVALVGGNPIQTAPHGGSLLTQAGWALYGAGRTLGHLVWPSGLMIEYPQAEWVAQGSPWTSLPVALAAATLLGTVLLRRRHPTSAFLLAWMLLAYLPSSSLLVTLRAVLNDRAAYPLLPAFGALVGLGAARWVRSPRLALVALALLGALLCARRTTTFRDEGTLWADVLSKAPRSVKAHLGLAWVYGQTDHATGQQWLVRAAALAERDSRLRGLALAQHGDAILRVDGDARRAAPILTEALRVLRVSREKPGPSPEESATAASLAWALWTLGQDVAAQQVLADAMAEQPDGVMFHLVSALQWWLRAEETGDEEARRQARRALQRAREIDPEHPIVLRLSARMDG